MSCYFPGVKAFCRPETLVSSVSRQATPTLVTGQPVTAGSSAGQPGSASRTSPGEKERKPKKKRKRTTKLQKAEKAGNAMVMKLIAANEEAGEIDWIGKRKCMNWRMQRRRREPSKIASG